MFLEKLFFFGKKPYTSPACRNAFSFYHNWGIKSKNKFLTVTLKNKSGRNDSGKIIIRSKASFLIKQRRVKINYSLRYLKIGTISSFSFLPFKNKLLSLMYYNNGSLSYYLTTNTHTLFTISGYNIKKKFRKAKIFNYFLMLFQIKKLSFVSCLELLPGKGAQYSRSSGTKCKIIKFDKGTHSVLVELPSKIKKIFSFYSFCLIGQISLPMHKKCFNNKAGYWRSFGSKSIVRGVAMNPVDHPHGGRTKAIAYPRTPWGKTTKFK